MGACRAAGKTAGGKVVRFPVAGRRAVRRGPRFRLNLGRLALIVAGVYLLAMVGAQLGHLVSLRLELARTQRVIQQVENQNAALREQVEYASGDEYIEQAARQLGLTRPGEILFSTSPERRSPVR